MTAQTKPRLKRCRECGASKPLSDFHQDKKGGRGVKPTCRECYNRGMRAKRRHTSKRRPMTAAKTTHSPTMMTDEAFSVYYRNVSLREKIRQYCRRHAKSCVETQQDYEMIAWGQIALCTAGKSEDYYYRIAERAIYRAYRRDYERRTYHLSDIELMSAAEYAMWSTGSFG
jgi:hypothetical protein